MIVYLVSTVDGRYDLELAAAEVEGAPAEGFWARRLDRLRESWARVVRDAQERPGASLWARWRTRIIRQVEESIDEQRSLWALRDRATATLVHPPELSSDTASAALRHLLTVARRHHVRWLSIDTVLFAASGLLMPVPGPNLIAYYFAFRLIGHYLSWRGARQALDAVSWTFEPRS